MRWPGAGWPAVPGRRLANAMNAAMLQTDAVAASAEGGGWLAGLWPSVPAAMVLGAACGVVGTLAVLRQRALMADTLAHAALPGVAAAFLIAAAMGMDGRSLPVLLAGATISGVLGIGLAHVLQRYGKLRDDAAMAAVLGASFGLGTVLLSVVQRSPAGGQAGLARFLFGQTAAIRSDDAVLIAGVAGACVLVVAALYKELRLLCFDAAFCAAIGRRPGLLDVLLLTMLTLVTVVGLQAVGLVLIVAMLIIPSLTARFLTDRLWLMMIIAGVVGAVSAGVGGAASAHVARLPAGPAIVSAAAVCLALAAVFAPGKGVVSRWVRRVRVTRQTIFEHALRRCYEAAEHGQRLPERHTRVLARRGLVLDAAGGDGVRLTPEGLALAEQVITRHRLWEAYLVTFGSQAPEHADDPADLIEHLHDPVLIRELEAAVRERSGGATPAVPQSPHALDAGKGRA